MMILMYACQSFNFVPSSMQEVLKALDPRKLSGPDFTDLHFLAADFIAEPLMYILTLQWKMRKFQGYRNLLLFYLY